MRFVTCSCTSIWRNVDSALVEAGISDDEYDASPVDHATVDVDFAFFDDADVPVKVQLFDEDGESGGRDGLGADR